MKFRDLVSRLKVLKDRNSEKREEMVDWKLLDSSAEELAKLAERYPEKRSEIEAEIDRRDQLNQSYQSYLNASPQNNALIAYQQQSAQNQINQGMIYQYGSWKPVQGALYTDCNGIRYIQTSPIDQLPTWVQFPPPPQNQPSQQIVYKLIYPDGSEVSSRRYDTWGEAEADLKTYAGTPMIRAEIKSLQPSTSGVKITYEASHVIPGGTQFKIQDAGGALLAEGIIYPDGGISIAHSPGIDSSEARRIISEQMKHGKDTTVYPEKIKVPEIPKPPKSLDERISIYSHLVERIDAMEKKVKVRTEPETDDLLDSLVERVKVLETKLSQLEKLSEKEKALA